LDTPGILDLGDKTKIDTLTPDYSILNEANFTYELQNSYIGYAIRGCPNGCAFSAVHQIEPVFNGYLPLCRRGNRRHLCSGHPCRREGFIQQGRAVFRKPLIVPQRLRLAKNTRRAGKNLATALAIMLEKLVEDNKLCIRIKSEMMRRDFYRTFAK